MAKGIRLRTSNQRINALLDISEQMKKEFTPANEHQILLAEHLIYLNAKLSDMSERNQEMYTLHMTGLESLAFYQLWNMLDISSDKYAEIIVSDLIKRIKQLNP